MMLHRLNIENIRNIPRYSLDCHQSINLFIGPNGTGKTSMLEAIHFLSLGRSFRTHLYKKVIRNGADYLLVQATIADNERVGIQKFSNSNVLIRKNGADLDSIAELSFMLPVQVIDPEAFRLLLDGPVARRQFIDWGVYQLFPEFYQYWRDYQRLLKQRNAALRSTLDMTMVSIWDPPLVQSALALDELRRSYLALFTPIFVEYFSKMLPDVSISLDFYSGWNNERELDEILTERLSKDRELGYTFSGPHRYDIRIKTDGGMAADIFSRGQQKLTVIAMKLAQAQLCSKDKRVILLLDDIVAELDEKRRELLASLIVDINSQCFITGVEASLLAPFTVHSHAILDFFQLNFN